MPILASWQMRPEICTNYVRTQHHNPFRYVEPRNRMLKVSDTSGSSCIFSHVVTVSYSISFWLHRNVCTCDQIQYRTCRTETNTANSYPYAGHPVRIIIHTAPNAALPISAHMVSLLAQHSRKPYQSNSAHSVVSLSLSLSPVWQ